MADAKNGAKRGGIWQVLRLPRAAPPAPPAERPPLRRGLPKTRLELDLLKGWN